MLAFGLEEPFSDLEGCLDGRLGVVFHGVMLDVRIEDLEMSLFVPRGWLGPTLSPHRRQVQRAGDQLHEAFLALENR